MGLKKGIGLPTSSISSTHMTTGHSRVPLLGGSEDTTWQLEGIFYSCKFNHWIHWSSLKAHMCIFSSPQGTRMEGYTDPSTAAQDAMVNMCSSQK